MNKCTCIIKNGINKGNVCNRNLPCIYHKINLEKKYENNPKEFDTIMNLFFIKKSEENNYSYPNNWHPNKHSLDWMF
jgi:hypothetical protein